MSRCTYIDGKNPADNFHVKEVGERFEVWVRSDRASDGSAPADHKHTSAPNFDDPEEAQEYIDGLYDNFEEDYEAFLEENSYEIAQMERYEAFRNEY